MAFGKITQEMKYQKSPHETLIDLEKALNNLGKVKKIEQTANTIHGRTRFGLQSVKIQATVNGNDDESIISFIAKSDDVGGVGARNGLDRLMETLENVDNLSYEVSKTGLNKLQWIYIILGGIGILVFTIMLSTNPDSVADSMSVIGILIPAYIAWGFFSAFKKK
jgi:hypothetical protein